MSFIQRAWTSWLAARKRIAAMSDPNATPEMLAEGAIDENWRVRRAVMRNPNATKELLYYGFYDPNPRVSDVVIDNDAHILQLLRDAALETPNALDSVVNIHPVRVMTWILERGPNELPSDTAASREICAAILSGESRVIKIKVDGRGGATVEQIEAFFLSLRLRWLFRKRSVAWRDVARAGLDLDAVKHALASHGWVVEKSAESDSDLSVYSVIRTVPENIATI